MSEYDELSKTLDNYLEGNWKRYDYDLHNAKTEIRKNIGSEDELIVYFGDSNTKTWHRPRLLLKYEKEDNGLRIIEVIKLNDELAYSNKAFDLLNGYLIK